MKNKSFFKNNSALILSITVILSLSIVNYLLEPNRMRQSKAYELSNGFTSDCDTDFKDSISTRIKTIEERLLEIENDKN